MDWKINDKLTERVEYWRARIQMTKDADLYFYNQPVDELAGNARAIVHGREMMMFASYSYLGLLGHPHINNAAKAAVDQFGTGTHGVRMLAGTLRLHEELEDTIAQFKQSEAAVTFSSGYVTNLTAISTLCGRHDTVFCDKLNHASIVDGCLLSGATFARFKHNDMDDLERVLKMADGSGMKLVVVDAVFSMDGDVVNLPRVAELCRKYGAWLMVDEAHSIGVLGKTGRGIEEHFGLGDVVDIKMGTLSKTIPSVGGYLAGKKDLIQMFKHASRAYIFSAALPPAQAAAAKAAFEVILNEPERVEILSRNTDHFTKGLKQVGFDTMNTTTAIVPVLCGEDERAFHMVQRCQYQDVFVLPVVSPAVPSGSARLRSTVTAGHTAQDIERALDVFEDAGKQAGII
ncbi:MAG TPA: aminotransferase class I/II-fold pyridoxal phosphate-dependent enzyme [Anaerolineales bacterium]|nr:aminotransferase class I/II-fold pyridoxal phosphate-dependent enzyme [Anaerolineales bacterium]